MINIIKTNDTIELNNMCIKFNQETRDMDKVSQAWLAYDDNKVVGCLAIKKINNKFDLAWLIVEDGYDDFFLKEELFTLSFEYLVEKGAKKVYINKQDWEFYKTRGFKEIIDNEMPKEFRYCASCKKRNISCFSKSMVLDII